MGEVIISKAQEADVAEILRLQYAAYQSEAEIYNDYSIPPLMQTLEQAAAEFQNCVVLKAVLDGKIIGSVRAYEMNETAYIGKLIVHPNFQNKSIGKELMQEIEQEFQGKRLELFTGAKSEKNLSFYKKCGYTQFKAEEVKSGLTLIYMEKR